MQEPGLVRDVIAEEDSMLKPLFDFLEKLVNEFSWRRLVFFVCLLVVVGGGVWIFESYTGYFRLARIEKEIALLAKMRDLSSDEIIRRDEGLQIIYDNARLDLKEFGIDRSVVNPTILKALTGAGPWLLFSLAFVSGTLRGDKTARNGLIGALIVALLVGGLGMFLPNFAWPVVNYLIIPLGSFFIFMVIAVLWQQRKKRPARS